MTDFKRNSSTHWHDEIPGTRWFVGDLHVHTLDDHPTTNFKYPEGVDGSPDDPSTQYEYAKAFLRAAVEARIEVLGLTPHAVRAGKTDQTSATWKIVEVWNNEDDEDGVPFRDKIYAIYPGFEPNLSSGDEGIHLLFLFDPEIGREGYLGAHNAVMGSMSPWENLKSWRNSIAEVRQIGIT